MRFAVGDVHGFRRELRSALQDAGLLDAGAHWSGGAAEVWFAGDLMDRGPDGVGVVADVMRWQSEAASAGGRVASVLGNHDLLALAVRRFGDQMVPGPSYDEYRNFAMSWLVNGGQARDQDLLTDDMACWLGELPPVAVLGADVLVHADTTEYLTWGTDADSINRAVQTVLNGEDLPAWWELWRTMTTRYAFLGEDGAARARVLLDVLGGQRLVHGHSVIGDLREVASTTVEAAWSYADGLVLAVDGGIYDGGPSLVVPLD